VFFLKLVLTTSTHIVTKTMKYWASFTGIMSWFHNNVSISN